MIKMPSKTPNLVFILYNRERGIETNSSTIRSFQKVAEERAACSEMQEIHCKLPNTVRSTFLMSFSPDSTKVASTHGDHKIYVCDVKTGKLLNKLEGHPRTPWCLAFHPTSNDILASGCLGGEVRIWHLHGGSEKWSTDHNTVITSLAFHPTDKVLAIATYNRIYFWDWSRPSPFAYCKTASDKEKVRYVKFNNLGTNLITGISNVVTSSSNTTSNNQETVQTSTPLTQRRNLLSRLINMYHNMDSSEPTYREPNPGNFEEVARRFNTTFRRWQWRQQNENVESLMNTSDNANVPSTSNSSSNNSEPSRIPEPREPLPSPVNEQFLMRAFWRTYHRLRLICSTLERRMQQLHRNAESQLNQMNGANNSNQPERLSESSNLGELQSELNYSANDVPNRSEFLIGILTHLQDSLRSITLPSSILQTQLHQLQWRMADILERLTNVSGYRARLSNLRHEILEVERTQRYQDFEVIRRQDLAHCLWLVEMSIQLTQQMQRILHADYRLAQLNITPNSQSSSTASRTASINYDQPSTSSSSINAGSFASREESLLTTDHNAFRSDDSNRASSSNQSFNRSLENIQFDLDSVGFLDNRLNMDWAGPSSRNSESEERQILRDMTSLPSLLEDLPSTSSFDLEDRNSSGSSGGASSSRLMDDLPNLPRHSLSHFITENFNRPPSGTGVPRLSEVSSFSFLEVDDVDVLYRREDSPIRSQPSSSVDFNQINLSGPVTSTPLGTSRLPRTPPSQFYVPEVRIDPAPAAEDAEPPPLHGRPRSPPLPAILSASNEFLLTSWLHSNDTGRQPLFGSHDYYYFHRIQSWDFTRFYNRPLIGDPKANVVVPKCKIHNDASVDISSDGQLLVALVPISNSGLESLAFAVYSLRRKDLGHCLYTWAYDSNAISVSFSPLSQYVVVGLASPRVYLSSSEKEAVAQIFQLKLCGNYMMATHVRSLAKQSNIVSHFPQVSLNSVKWLPQPGQGLIYGTNRGCLCICKPVSPMMEKSNNKTYRLTHDYNLSLGIRSRNSLTASVLHSLTTTARNLIRQTRSTGTQTFRTGRSSNASR